MSKVDFHADRVTVGVKLRRRRLVCPECGYSTGSRVETRPRDSSWRGLDLGVWKVIVTTRLRRLDCPEHGVIVEAVPFARHRARFTRDFEALVAWCATRMDATAVSKLVRIAWPTVGAIVARVTVDEIDPHRLDDLYELGVDEISYRKWHNYLTVVVDHAKGKVVWTDEGKDSATLDRFFAELGPCRAKKLTAVSMDMGKAYPKSVAEHASQAAICWDPFHVVALGTKALDTVRRAHWNHLREQAGPETARRFKGARWALLKNPPGSDLSTGRQSRGAQAGRRRRLACL